MCPNVGGPHSLIVVLWKCMLSMMSDGILSQVEVGGLLHVYLMLLVMPIDFLKRLTENWKKRIRQDCCLIDQKLTISIY